MASRAPICGGWRVTAPRASRPRQLLAEVLGAFEFASARDDEPIAVARLQPDARRARLRAARLGAGDQHRRPAVPGRLRLGRARLARARGGAAAAPDHRHRARRRRPDHRRRPTRAARRTASRSCTSTSSAGSTTSSSSRARDAPSARRSSPCARSCATSRRCSSASTTWSPLARAGAARYAARRGRGGRRLPRLAAARRVRLPRRARVRLHRGRHLVVHGSGLGHPARRGALRVREPRAVRRAARPASASALDGDLLLVDKTNAASPVHRRERMDYIGVRRVVADGEIVGDVAPARPLHDEGLRRARLRDAAAAPQAAPVRSTAGT